jgi:multiple sugar transport system permease protein
MKSQGRLSRFFNEEGVAGYIFVLPFIIGFLSFILIPLITSAFLALTKYDVLSAPVFIGFGNFKRMFTQDPVFLQSLGVTFLYAFVSVPLRLIMALIVAMLFQRTTRLTSVYRGVFYLPSIMGGSIAVAILWRQMFASNGAFNTILNAIGIPCHVSWLGDEHTAIWVLILMAVWQFGSAMLIFIAGLKQIPVTLYEAATVDGSGKARQFFQITLPMLTPVIFFNLIQQIIQGFMAFTQSYIVTQGGPMNSTLFYAVYMYQRSFKFYEMGYGSALAWLMLIIVGAITLILFKTSDKWVYRTSEEG